MMVRERRNSSAGKQLVAVKQVTTEHFSSSLIAEIANMDASALSLVFDKQLRQRLVILVQQPVGSRVVIAVILRSVQLESSRIEDNISRMVMTNFETCCMTKQGCAVVETCLENFSVDNKLMIAEQLLEMDNMEQLTEFWTHGSHVFTLSLDLLEEAGFMLSSLSLALTGHFSSLATNVRFYKPVKSLLAKLASTDSLSEILAELEEDLVMLACHRFGYRVVVSLLEAELPPATRESLVERFQGRIAELPPATRESLVE